MRGKPGASPGTHSDRRRCALTGLTRVNFPHPFLDGTPTTDDFRRPTRATAIVPMFVGWVHSRRLARSNHRTQASALVLLPGQGEPGGEPPRHGPPRGWGVEKSVLHKLRFPPGFVAPFSLRCEGGSPFSPPLRRG